MNFKACNIVSAPFLQAFPNQGKAPFLSGTRTLCGKVTKISHILPTLFDKCFQTIHQTDAITDAIGGLGRKKYSKRRPQEIPMHCADWETKRPASSSLKKEIQYSKAEMK